MVLDHLLSWLVFIPLIAAVVMIGIPNSQNHLLKWIALGALSIVTILSIVLVLSFDKNVSGYGVESLQFTQQLDWIQMNVGSFGSILIQYYLGVDGLSLALVLLSAIVLFIGEEVADTLKLRYKRSTFG